LSLIAGDPGDTLAVVSVGGAKLRIAQYKSGARTVTDEQSAVKWRPRLDSPTRRTDVTFLFKDHPDLTGEPVFIDDVLHLLLGQRHKSRFPLIRAGFWYCSLHTADFATR
jgi:hypothetical protein